MILKKHWVKYGGYLNLAGYLYTLSMAKAAVVLSLFFKGYSIPVYHFFGCGCKIDIDFENAISSSGFVFESSNTSKIKTSPITGYIYFGVAKKEKNDEF